MILAETNATPIVTVTIRPPAVALPEPQPPRNRTERRAAAVRWRKGPTRARAAALAGVLGVVQACAPAPALAAPCEAASGLHTGKPAPCDGVLWPAPWTAEALRCRRVELPACQADARQAAAMAAADLQAAQAQAQAWRQLADERRVLLERLAAAPPEPPPPWYSSPWVWAGAGVVVGVAATAGAVHLAGQLGRWP